MSTARFGFAWDKPSLKTSRHLAVVMDSAFQLWSIRCVSGEIMSTQQSLRNESIRKKQNIGMMNMC